MERSTEVTRTGLVGTLKSAFIGLLFTAAFVLLLVTGLMYFLGLAYLDVYYDYFGVDVRLIDLSFNYVVAESMSVVIPASGAWIECVCMIGILWGVSFYDLKKTSARKWSGSNILNFIGKLSLWSSIIWLVSMAFGIVTLQLGAARAAAAREFERSSAIVQLTFSQSPDTKPDPELLELNSEGSLRSLVQTKDLLVVYTKCDAGVSIRSFIIPMKNVVAVKSIRLQQNLTSPPNPCLGSNRSWRNANEGLRK